jgi:hypothetical protein
MSSTSSCDTCGIDYDFLCPACAAERRARLAAARAKAGARAPARATAHAPATATMAVVPATTRSRSAPPAARPGRQRMHGGQGRDHDLIGRAIQQADGKRMARMGWLAVGALTLVTVLVLLFVMHEQDVITTGRHRHEQRLDEIVATIRAFQLDQEDQAKAAKDYITVTQKEWQGERIENEVSSLRATVNEAIRRHFQMHAVNEALIAIESSLTGKPGLDTLGQQFAAVRDQELAAKVHDVGAEYQTRYAHVLQIVTERYLDALKGSLAGAASATTRDALAPYGLYEDALRTLVNEAGTDATAIQQYQPELRRVTKEVNELVMARFDEAFVKSVPPKDLLLTAGDWQESRSASFQMSFGQGSLALTNAAGEGASSGGLSYQPGDHWRDYALDMEFQLESGTLIVYTRVADKMDLKQVPGFSIGTIAGTRTPNVVVEYGKPITLSVSTIGNVLTVVSPDHSATPYRDEIISTKSRRGEPAIEARAGTKVTFSKLKARLLR